jgi:NCS2 family nucleobase:cation symporter-2
MTAAKGGLLYNADDIPPLPVVVLSAFQHIGIATTSLAYQVVLAREAGLTLLETLEFISVGLLALGVGTVLISARSKYVGSGYLCPAGFTPVYFGPAVFALQRGGLALLFGMTMLAGLVQVGLAPLMRRLRALLPTEIAGLVIAAIGLAVASLGLRYGLGLSKERGGIEPSYVIVSGTTLLIMIGLNIWTEGYLKAFCVLIASLVGFALSMALGIPNPSATIATEQLAWVRFPFHAHPGWQFDFALVAPFVVAAVAGMFHLLGSISTAQRINDPNWVRPNFRSLSGGVSGSGSATFLAGLSGSVGVDVYSPCIGLSAATGVTSRRVAYAMGIILAVASFFPLAALKFVAVPDPIVGATLFFTAVFIFINGLQMITARMLDTRKTIVIGFSFAMSVLAESNKEAFATLPVVLQPIFGSSLMLGTTCAVLLNAIMRIGVRQRASLEIDLTRNYRDAVEEFLLVQGGHWGARRQIVDRAVFGVVQALEVIGSAPGGVQLEASFDEYNLELRIRYVGAKIVIPDRRPDPLEIGESEEGERLFAGYLLKQSADRISSRADGERAELHLHYDH